MAASPRLLFIATSALLTASCAKDPDSIAPSYISNVAYQSYTCEQLTQEQAHLSRALTTASAQQKNARTNDMVGVALIGLPVSSLSGDNIAPEIARLKGEQEAVRKEMSLRPC